MGSGVCAPIGNCPGGAMGGWYGGRFGKPLVGGGVGCAGWNGVAVEPGPPQAAGDANPTGAAVAPPCP